MHVESTEMSIGHFRVAGCLGFKASLGANSVCVLFLYCFWKMLSLICIRIRNSFPFELLCTRTRFESEACSNSEKDYSL